MKKIIYLILCLMFVGLTNATAATNRFTATSSSYGVLGWMDFDSSIFDGTSFQFVANTSMLSIDFTNPLNSYHITTIGPDTYGTYFNSFGVEPTVVGGWNQQGGTNSFDGVTIIGSDFVILGDGDGHNIGISGVTWNTSVVGAVPEPEIYAMLGVGLGLMGWVGRRRTLQAA